MQKDNINRILIRRKKRILGRRVILKTVLFTLIATISGVITSKLILNSYTENCNVDNSNKVSEVEKEFFKSVEKVSSSLVTISESYENIVSEECENSNFTGVVIDKSGYIITSLTKVKNMTRVYVKLPYIKEPIEGTIIGKDEFTDMALVKVNIEEGLTPIEVYSGKDVKEGDFVITAGNVLCDEFTEAAIMGVIIAANKKVYDEVKGEEYTVLETNAIINDNNIGGVLCNLNGELIGFNSYTLNNKDSKLNYVLRVTSAKEIVSNLLGITDKLGIIGSAINDEKANVTGVYIENVRPNRDAAKAGILPTDIILSINDNKINTQEDIYNAIKDKKSGDTIICDLLRDGKKTTMNIQFS